MGPRKAGALWLLAVCLIALSAAVGVDAESGNIVSRVLHKLKGNDGRPSGVTWVVQLSDLHLSLYHPERAEALEKLMPLIIAAIQPALVLITGDLTDAKNKDGSATQQYEEDWVTYQSAVDAMSAVSGIKLSRFYDLRGNHDKYGVPFANSSLDYFSKYSCNARQERMGLVQSITLLEDSGRKTLFVGFDDSMSVGLRGPSNIFGHPSDEVISQLDRELSRWDNEDGVSAKIVFGHFPMSFTTSSESGHRLQEVMSRHNVSTYLCGHLHCKFGRQLYKHHQTKGLGEFWEWEMGDWRVNRMMRILAVDHGRVSFVDVDLSKLSKDVLNGQQFEMPTIIVPTSPVDCRIMLRSESVSSQAYGGAIRALIFSKSRPTSVTATVYDSQAHAFVDYVMVGSMKMNLVSGSESNEQGGAFFYEALWDSQNYTDSSAARFWVQIQVMENGVSTKSSMWPFSVEGKRGKFSLSFLGYIAIGIDWSAVYPVIIWTIISVILGGFLILPRLGYLYMEKKGIYNSWAYSLFHPTSESSFPYVQLPIWALLEGARHGWLWFFQVLYIAFLLMFPWFWGKVLADDYPVGYMTIWGWTVWPSKGTVAQLSGVGWPDVMQIVLPYICAVVLPMVLMVSALCAEQAACELVDAVKDKSEDGSEKRSDAKKTNGGSCSESSIGLGRLLTQDVGGEEGRPLLKNAEAVALSEEEELEAPEEEKGETVGGEPSSSSWKFLTHRKVRKVYFLGCFIIIALHLKLCMFLASAYGAQPVFLSPIYVWTVPTLIVVAIFMTSPVKPRNL